MSRAIERVFVTPARSYSAVLGCGYALSIKNNDTIIVDGTEGIVLVNPGKNRIEEYKQKKEAYKTDAAQAIDNFFIEELKKL